MMTEKDLTNKVQTLIYKASYAGAMVKLKPGRDETKAAFVELVLAKNDLIETLKKELGL